MNVFDDSQGYDFSFTGDSVEITELQGTRVLFDDQILAEIADSGTQVFTANALAQAEASSSPTGARNNLLIVEGYGGAQMGTFVIPKTLVLKNKPPLPDIPMPALSAATLRDLTDHAVSIGVSDKSSINYRTWCKNIDPERGRVLPKPKWYIVIWYCMCQPFVSEEVMRMFARYCGGWNLAFAVVASWTIHKLIVQLKYTALETRTVLGQLNQIRKLVYGPLLNPEDLRQNIIRILETPL